MDWKDSKVKVVDVTTKTSSKSTKVLTGWSLNLELVTSISSEGEVSSLVSLESEVVQDITVSTVKFSDVFISG